MMSMLDRNTLLSLNKDNKSIDQHQVALAKMKSVNIAPDAKHAFIEDRARGKSIKNIDDLYSKLNDLEKNGVLDIWIKKFGKDKYMSGRDLKESIEIAKDFLIENGNIKIVLDKSGIVEEMDGAATPIAPYVSGPGKNQVINKYPEPTLTHQDPGAAPSKERK